MKNVKMFKLFESKKAINDVSIIGIILFIFIGTGVVLPFVNDEFDITTPTYDIDNVGAEFIEEDFSDISDIGAGNILTSIGKMFFWTFGDLPIWLDLIFVVLRILLLFILIRNFVPFIGGGG